MPGSTKNDEEEQQQLNFRRCREYGLGNLRDPVLMTVFKPFFVSDYAHSGRSLDMTIFPTEILVNKKIRRRHYINTVLVYVTGVIRNEWYAHTP